MLHPAFSRLMQKQQRLLHRDPEPIVIQEEPISTEEELFNLSKIKSTVKYVNEYEIDGHHDPHDDMCKPWNKLSNNLKVKAMTQYIETLIPALSNEQKIQLKYILISAVTDKKTSKHFEVGITRPKDESSKSIDCHIMDKYSN